MTIAVQTKRDVLGVLRHHTTMLRSLGVKRLGLFGSFARDTATEQSDIDIFVEFAPGQKTFDNYMQLVFHLEELFGRPVELVTAEALSPYLSPHILRETEYVTLEP